MKPNPLSLLNHFTVPVSGIPTSDRTVSPSPARAPHRICRRSALAAPFIRAMSLPDQSAIHPDALKSERLVETDGRLVEVVDEQRDRFSFAEKMAADLAQHLEGEPLPAVARLGPDAHQLHGIV